MTKRPVVLVTGVGRKAGIGAAIATRMADDGWDVATDHWLPYDDRMFWGGRPADVEAVAETLRGSGAWTTSIAADLALVSSAAEVFDEVEAELGPVTALVLSHCESVDSGLLDTEVDSCDRHYAVGHRRVPHPAAR